MTSKPKSVAASKKVAGTPAKTVPSSKKAPIADCVTGYLELVFRLSHLTAGARCYRGESDKNWQLKPSIMRGVRSEAESRIFSELMVEAPAEFSSDRTMFDKLVRAQHYSLPTRLLDVSLNPLVGLYFACNEEQHHDKDGKVRVFDCTPPPKAVCCDLLIGFKSMPYVMRYSHFPH